MSSAVGPRTRLVRLVIIGGLIGSALRTVVLSAMPVDGFPWPTVVVNLTGVAVIGVALPRLRGRRDQMAFWVIGIGGAATTFSALTLDAIRLLEAGQFAALIGYVFASVVGGFLTASAAVHLGGRLKRRPRTKSRPARRSKSGDRRDLVARGLVRVK